MGRIARQEPDDRNIPLADRRAEQETDHDEPDFAEEFTQRTPVAGA
ncbi:hypothetical protein [Planotetraspora phitsanulokensis]|nr:hypothetical protein [Planotetraspora phitsanulokensis]